MHLSVAMFLRRILYIFLWLIIFGTSLVRAAYPSDSCVSALIQQSIDSDIWSKRAPFWLKTQQRFVNSLYSFEPTLTKTGNSLSRDSIFRATFFSPHTVLTAFILRSLIPGVYSYVVLAGEDEIRLGYHPKVNKTPNEGNHSFVFGSDVWAAGEIIISNDLNGEPEITEINPKSGTYKIAFKNTVPFTLSLLWKNQIYPKNLVLKDIVSEDTFVPVLFLHKSEMGISQ